jgi:polar amino acid transport system substrate-binding protein
MVVTCILRLRACLTGLVWLLVSISVVTSVAVLSEGAATAAQDDLGTIEPGKLIVAFTGDMPMSSIQDGTLVGTDGEMISRIADALDLEIVPQQMDWAAAIESVTTGRVDLMIGAVGWTADRSSAMLLSDPIYYFGVFLAQTSATTYHTFADMAGKKVGTVTGFSLVPELKSVPGIGEVRLYDTSEGVIRDLVASRLDIAILDPALVALAVKEHPEWGVHQLPLDPDPAYPIMSTKYNATIGIRLDGAALADAINAQIAQFWNTCENQTIMATYGITDPSFFLPPVPNSRVGVDRPQGWESPILNAACDANTVGRATPPN